MLHGEIKMKYEGTILGFNYIIDKENDKEFQIWLKEMLLKFLLNPDDPATVVVKDILGIKELEEKISTLEKKDM